MNEHKVPHNLHVLFEASRRLNDELELEKLLAVVRDLTLVAMDAEACSLLLWNGDRTRLDFYLAYNQIQPKPHRISLQPGEGLAGWIADSGSPVLLNDVAQDPRFRHVIDRERGFSTRSVLGLPLYRGERVFGVLEVLNKKETGGFDPDDLHLMEALGDQISVALDNALTYRRATREHAEKEALYRVGLVLSQKLELEEIIQAILEQVREVVPYDVSALYLIEQETGELQWFAQTGYPPGTEEKVRLKLGQGAVGWVANQGTPLIIPDVHQDDRYFCARETTSSEIVIPIISGSKTIGVLNLESDEPDAYRTADSRVLTSFASQAAISIERAHLYAELKEKERLEHELRVARVIQQSFLPSVDPVIEGFDLSAINIPSDAVSGDAYDYIEISHEQIGIMIGDVSGKGVSAALIMATLRASLRAEIHNRFSITEIMSKVNRLLHESIDPGKFVTAVYGVLDPVHRIFTYVNAGHNPPIWMRKDGEVDRLRHGGPILGPYPEAPFSLGVVQLEPGDLLAFYTDGVTEAGQPTREPFGAARLIERLRSGRHQESAVICRDVVEDVRRYTGSVRGADDITIVVLRALETPETA